MIGLVIVSHSPRLAEAAVELGLKMVHGSPPPIRIAAGVDGHFGTDAAAVAAAIDEIGEEPGVLVITDLGSAVLSAGLALELRESSTEVLVSAGPFVEGITAGVVLAATGAPLEEVAREVAGALDAKRDQLEPMPDAPPPTSWDPLSVDEVLINPEGLHTRPAAMFVQTVGGYDALVDVTNLTTGIGPVTAKSMIGLLSLGAKQGHRIKLDGHGPDAATAVSALRGLLADGFGEVPSGSAAI
ncbi:HPr family phosphocarrier protein [Agromyces sp. Soil535]|uniref:HPr family phosphocarrier protein n=1 Tax=Agromyces sp. Soil535 TaxID=1736390 RepID=UPI0006F5876C|nr:HPr family phosphocarrier protein [Agromyces sp. Soil535]KRE23163.1 phosphocarrier, HPr family protein [Agromyces sp. Soil535]